MPKPHADWQEKIKRKNAGRFLERTCVVCGADLQIVLNADGNIISGGYYFNGCGGDDKPDWEYWECLDCYEDEDE